jgi:hypothetical protein
VAVTGAASRRQAAAFHDIAVTSAPKKSKEEREMVDTATASIKAIMRTSEDFYAF